MSRLRALLGSCHLGPTLVVTLLATALAAAAGLGARVVLVAAAVFCGQLTIGWSNDLLDAARDRAAGRRDKPIANGTLGSRDVVGAIVVAGVGAVAFSLLLGTGAAFVHVVLVVGSGWAYNLGLKRTLASFVPYGIAFGALPGVITLTTNPPAFPPSWMVAAGALLGVGAHALNVLPDLDDDAATGVRGLPHALGARGLRVLAATSLLAGAVAGVLGARMAAPIAVAVLLLCAALALVTVRGQGRRPFLAAMGIALVVVAGLLVGA